MLFRTRSFGATEEQLVQLNYQRIRPVLECPVLASLSHKCTTNHPGMCAESAMTHHPQWPLQQLACNLYQVWAAFAGKQEKPTYHQLRGKTKEKRPPEPPPTTSTNPDIVKKYRLLETGRTATISTPSNT
ncbi:hypothetical protein Pcinc_012192 [Petrolisthes cinctipes]|uniref:Uncharacterized protein n=1 Tax=Petrolisthes cinctipes TaxID=88211 RepID=A0AAE1KTS5_PETCI|nr:hypothetical protein Pcinc_012192 [Petrolisthes cinctipes]